MLFDVYQAMFEQEDAWTFFRQNQQNLPRAFSSSNFVLPLKLVMDPFIDLESETDQLMPMNTVNRNDFYAHLYRQRVHNVDYYRSMERVGGTAMRIGRFSEWDIVPPVVRVILTIPREKIRQFEDTLNETRVGTPLLHWSHNTFTAIHVAYGRVIPIGTRSNPRVCVEEDPEGRGASFDLVAATYPLQLKMGLDLLIYGASLMDAERVHVLPESQIPSAIFASPAVSYVSPNTTLQTQLGSQRAVSVELDEQCELVSSFTARVDIEDAEVEAMPEIEQASPCTMQLTVAGHVQVVVFPFTIIGTQRKLRLARKSRYIEPPAGPFLKPDGMKLNPFPVMSRGRVFSLWSMHRLGSELNRWLDPHVGSMLSTRERQARKKRKEDALLYIKENIGTMLVRSAGIQGGKPIRAFSLADEATNNCDTVFFINGLRYDLPSHTVVCEGFVLPLTHDFMPKIEKPFGRLVNSAWKQLIPACVERCRTWEHAESCEYLARQAIPLTQKMEADPLCSCGRGKDINELMKWRVETLLRTSAPSAEGSRSRSSEHALLARR
ncbi:hypothetical protein L227DRAFT_591795 [Lentinus tigrinus ALCF2SS1-6]|uniref:Uncharacterized protein n=1 Tax=Lentinus tigrinus ALCF2SS1-6 TaxID=1328759 RepID=A0A5C2SKZ8_9APHY|nr:hypothetical protein L227DRAFT_591795 [Lentinus tigrinus ALCF2SS1-6]